MLLYNSKTDKRILDDSNLDTLNIFLYHDASDDVATEFPEVYIGPDTDAQLNTDGSYPTAVLVDGEEVGRRNPYNSIKQIADYLFEVEYSTANIDYDYANRYFKKSTAAELKGIYGVGACTGIVKDSKVLRHFDYYYNDTVEFILRRTADPENKIHASIGVCSGFRKLTKSIVESGKYFKDYKIVPFAVADGINDAGLYIQQNVVPMNGIYYDIHPEATKECCITMLPRYILDYCADFDEVKSVLDSLHIYSNVALDFGLHYLIAKGNDWRVIEFTADGYKIVGPVGSGCDSEMPNGIITNFRTTDLTFDSNGKVDWSSIEDYGLGVERFDIATTLFTDSEATWDGLRTSLKYSHLYTDDPQTWKTEESGEEDSEGHKLTVMDAKDSSYDTVYATLFANDKATWNAKTRADGKGVWQTVHSAIYDLSTLSFNIAVQERLDETYDFSLFGSDTEREVAQLKAQISNLNTEIANLKTIKLDKVLKDVDDETKEYTIVVKDGHVAIQRI